MAEPYIVPLAGCAAPLELTGGKGANLARLIEGGFPVPPGFVVTTAAYDAFVIENSLQAYLPAVLNELSGTGLDELESASAAIRARFEAGRLPPTLAEELRARYEESFPGDAPVAVRSSATAEDLPDLSFAGQQDTYLNVAGASPLQEALVRCWSSLWTGRAIGYRARNGIPQESVSLAVVVQAMVQAEAAGVLFTANPLTGRRTESAIDATLGLGEALVSGQVEPDHYVVDNKGPRIVEKHLGAKVPLATQDDHRTIQALPDQAILDLVALGARVQSHFGAPQDIEWTWAEQKLSLVQSRPITSLYPLPTGIDPAGQMHVLASFGAFQGVLDPLTPLGIDALRSLAAAVANLLGLHVTWETQGAVKVAGERLWIELTPLLRNGLGRRLLRGALGQVEPGIGQAIRDVLDDPRLAVTAERPSGRLIRRVAPLLLPMVGRFLVTLVRPDAARRAAQRSVAQTIERYETLADQAHSLRERLLLVEQIVTVMLRFFFAQMLPRFVPGMAALNQLYHLCDELPGGRLLALEVLRGLPHNVTTEMDLVLWETAKRIRADEPSAAVFASRDSRLLAGAYQQRQLPPVAQEALDAFLARYAMRGLAEIDLGRLRWRDDPTAVMDAVKSYLCVTDARQAPDAIFARGAVSADQAVRRISDELRRTHGIRQAARARWMARRVRALAGLRESPKFTIVNLLDIARKALLETGTELAQAGYLRDRQDIFFVPMAELFALAEAQERGEDLSGWRTKLCASVDTHRGRYEREKHRRQIPRLMLSDGTVFYEGVGAAQGAEEDAAERIVGSPVSPGVVEGRVRVILSPVEAQLQPGEILVCPGTDPSWTPLFLVAGGLIMEVGGLMTHGSVVAREYGIPAVVGVTHATSRLKTGERVRIDGSHGMIERLDAIAV